MTSENVYGKGKEYCPKDPGEEESLKIIYYSKHLIGIVNKI